MMLQKIDKQGIYGYDYEMDFDGNIELINVTIEKDDQVIVIWNKDTKNLLGYNLDKHHHTKKLWDLINDEMDQLC